MYRADKLQCLLPDSDSTIALNWYHGCSNSIAKAKLKAMLQLKRQSENRESAGRAAADGEKLTLYIIWTALLATTVRSNFNQL